MGRTTEERTWVNAVDKLRDEMAKSPAAAKLQLLGEGLTAMVMLHPEWEANILKDGKTISGALEKVKANAKGGCSDPIQTTKSLVEYYGLNVKDVHRLTLEITREMIGEGEGETKGAPSPAAPVLPHCDGEAKEAHAADPFDLDALMGVL